MRATILGILAAGTLTAGFLSLSHAAFSDEATEQRTKRLAKAAGMTQIQLIDALPDMDGGTSHVALMLASSIDLAHATGISLGRAYAPLTPASGKGLAEIQARTKAALLKGEIDGAILPLAAFQRHSALFAADQIPFLVVDVQSNARFIEALTPMIDERLAEHGLALLALVPMRPVGVMGTPRRPSGLPRKIAVGDAAGRRLAELIGAEAIETPTHAIHQTQAEAGYTGIEHHNADSAAPPGEARKPHRYQLLAMASWPLGMIVVRRDLVATKRGSVRDLLWPQAARQFEETRKRWQASMAPAYWKVAGLVNTAPAASPAEGHQSDGRADNASDTNTATESARLRAAGLTMAREWAIDAGADGFDLLEKLNVPITDAEPQAPSSPR